MISFPSPCRRALSAALAALYLTLALAAGAHQGSHVSDPAALPADLHHHAYAFVEGAAEPPAPADLCVACLLSRLGLRLGSAPAAVLVAPAATFATPRATDSAPALPELATRYSRAPPAL